jgi:hypothetical protein
MEISCVHSWKLLQERRVVAGFEGFLGWKLVGKVSLGGNSFFGNSLETSYQSHTEAVKGGVINPPRPFIVRSAVVAAEREFVASRQQNVQPRRACAASSAWHAFNRPYKFVNAAAACKGTTPLPVSLSLSFR